MTPGTLAARIAWRYLRSPKSHSAVTAISAVSLAGVAVATAAIVCVLSVFNGFQELLGRQLDTLAPDIVLTPAKGKVLANADSLVKAIEKVPGVEIAMATLADNALTIVDGREMPVTLKGVTPARYSFMTSVDSLTLGGTSVSAMRRGEAVISVGTARRLGIHSPGVGMLIFAPRREGRVNMANPMESFVTDSLVVADVFQSNQSQYDDKTVLCDISQARWLFDRGDECSAIEVSVEPGQNLRSVVKAIRSSLPAGLAVAKDRMEQQEVDFRMVQIEKWVTFLLLIFILVIASFNLVSTLCMLVLEKQGSMATLKAMGMTAGGIGRIFCYESMYVSAIGAVGGVVAGLALCLVQQYFGIIKLGGDADSLVVSSYPVKVEWIDVIAAMCPALVIGALAALLAAAFARSRARSAV